MSGHHDLFPDDYSHESADEPGLRLVALRSCSHYTVVRTYVNRASSTVSWPIEEADNERDALRMMDQLNRVLEREGVQSETMA